MKSGYVGMWLWWWPSGFFFSWWSSHSL